MLFLRLTGGVCMYVCMLSGWAFYFFANFNLLSVVLSRQIWYFWKGLDATSLF